MDSSLDALLAQLRLSKPKVAAAVAARLYHKRKVQVARYSRSERGKAAENDLDNEGVQIWQRTAPALRHHTALLRAFMEQAGRFPTVKELNG